MLQHRQLAYVFIPALLLAGLALFIQIVKYEPQFPKTDPNQKQAGLTVPILSDDIITGPAAAPTMLVVFSDFACAACNTQHGYLSTVQTESKGKLKIVWKMLPVAQFPYPSENATRYGYCANKENKFNSWSNTAFANAQDLSDGNLKIMADTIKLTSDSFTKCLGTAAPQQYVDKVKQVAQILNIQSVPTFFLNNQQIQPGNSVAEWKTILHL